MPPQERPHNRVTYREFSELLQSEAIKSEVKDFYTSLLEDKEVTRIFGKNSKSMRRTLISKFLERIFHRTPPDYYRLFHDPEYLQDVVDNLKDSNSTSKGFPEHSKMSQEVKDMIAVIKRRFMTAIVVQPEVFAYHYHLLFIKNIDTEWYKLPRKERTPSFEEYSATLNRYIEAAKGGVDPRTLGLADETKHLDTASETSTNRKGVGAQFEKRDQVKGTSDEN